MKDVPQTANRVDGLPADVMRRLVTDYGSDVMYSITANGEFSYLSPSLEATSGWSPDRWVGKPFHDIVHPDDVPKAREYFAAAVESAHEAEVELRVRTASGAYMTAKLHSVPWTDDGAGPGAAGIARLLSPEREEHAKRESAQAGLAFLAEASEILGSSLDFETTLTNVASLAVVHMCDWCMVDLLEEDGVTRRIALTHPDPEKLRLARELEDRYPPRPEDLPETLKSGRSQFVPVITDEMLKAGMRDDEHLQLIRDLGLTSAIVVPLNARGRTLGAITFIASDTGKHFAPDDLALAEDLGRRAAIAVDNARLYRQTQDALRLREDFLSIASHELKTPLTGLQLQLQILQRALTHTSPSGPPPDKVRQMIEVASKQTKRLSKLINDLLDVSRIAAGRADLDRQDVDVVALASEVIGRFSQESFATGSDISLNANEPIHVFADSFQLDQVLTNLLSNALKYGRGKPVDVVVEKKDVSVRISVQDRGIGIGGDMTSRVFDRFERVALEQGYGGLGLGLYIAQQIVHAHGGTIRVTSHLGEGSTFIVDLPSEAEA